MRTTQSIDAASRTLLAEVDVDNPTGELLPGAYAQVHLKLQTSKHGAGLPVNTLLFRPEGLRSRSCGPDQRVVLKKIVLGRDFGTEVEVVSGLEPNDAVILNPSDSLTAGTQVRVVKEIAEKKRRVVKTIICRPHRRFRINLRLTLFSEKLAIRRRASYSST